MTATKAGTDLSSPLLSLAAESFRSPRWSQHRVKWGRGGLVEIMELSVGIPGGYLWLDIFPSQAESDLT